MRVSFSNTSQIGNTLEKRLVMSHQDSFRTKRKEHHGTKGTRKMLRLVGNCKWWMLFGGLCIRVLRIGIHREGYCLLWFEERAFGGGTRMEGLY